MGHSAVAGKRGEVGLAPTESPSDPSDGAARPRRSTAGQRRQTYSPSPARSDRRRSAAGNHSIHHQFQIGDYFWFQYQRAGSQGNGKYFAGKVTDLVGDTLTWQWCDTEDRISRRIQDVLQQGAEKVTKPEMTHLLEDSCYSKAEVEHLLATTGPAIVSDAEMDDLPELVFDGFRNAQNRVKWGRLLSQWLPTFDPAQFLIGKINAEAPTGEAAKAWTDCVRAITALQDQTQHQRADGTYESTELNDQLQMLARCLPILLLRVPRTFNVAGKVKIVKRNCAQFLRGEWRSLVVKAQRELQQAAKQVETRTPISENEQQERQRRIEVAAEQTRKLNYSKAMNILRSAGLSKEDPAVVLQQLQDLHPDEEPVFDDYGPPGAIQPSETTFDFIDGEWLERQLSKSRAGTAVDQWGWDSREMWATFRKDDSLLHDIARLWIRPIAAGYLPPRYREHLAGGRLVALSKHPKPGVRPICISDSWRRLTARGLGAACQQHFRKFFQESNPTGLQFGGNTPNGANNMYHLLASMANSNATRDSNLTSAQQAATPAYQNSSDQREREDSLAASQGRQPQSSLSGNQEPFSAGPSLGSSSPNSWDIMRAQLSDSSGPHSDAAGEDIHGSLEGQTSDERGTDQPPRPASETQSQFREGRVTADPLVILALDVKNAFNSLTRQHLCEFLQQGTHVFTTLEGDDLHDNRPVGWDLLWRHVQAHYGCKGILKYYHSGQVSHILSQSGVQQGDPLGSTLFALVIHPILLDIASNFDVVIAAYADNVIFTGNLSEVIRAQERYRARIAAIGLRLNPAESQLHIPECKTVPKSDLMRVLSEDHFQDHNGEIMAVMLNGDLIPLRQQGLKVLGCPLGSDEYCRQVLEEIATKIEKDLTLLKEFPCLHQRLKLAIFCSNTRATYFLRTMAPHIAEPLMTRLDASFNEFLAHTLSFPPTFRTESPLIPYDKALQQARLGIKQGGCGLTSLAMLVPAALFSSICAFVVWLHEESHIPLMRLPWLLDHSDQHSLAFSHIHRSLEMSTNILVNKWGLSVGEEPEGPNEVCLPSETNILSWNPKRLPTQFAITSAMKAKLRRDFHNSLSSSDQKRLEAVSLHTVPADCPDSAIGFPAQQPKKVLRQCSMGHFALTCYHELSNNALLTSTALLLGYPIPHARFLKQHVVGYFEYDLWGDHLLNNSAHASRSRILSHNIVSQEIAHIASGGGIPTTAKSSEIPMADDDSNCRGDLMTFLGGRIPLKPTSVFSIMDFTLRHVFTGSHVYKPDVISEAEKLKRQKYVDSYQQRGFAFAPLVATTLGVFGPDLLRFLWAVADHAARYAFDLPLDVYLSLSQPSTDVSERTSEKETIAFKVLRGRLYNEYRLRTLTAVYEAVTSRVFGRSFALNTCRLYRELLASTRTTWQPIFHSLPADGLTSPVAEGTSQGAVMPASTLLSSPHSQSSSPDPLAASRVHVSSVFVGCA